MKKIILGIFGFFVGLSAFCSANIIGILDIQSSTSHNIYYGITNACNFSNTTTPKNIISYGFGKPIDNSLNFQYFDLSGNLVSVPDSCSLTGNPGIYVSGLNNGYYYNGSGEYSFLGSTFNSWSDNAFPFSLFGEFRLGLDSNNLFNGNIYFYNLLNYNQNYRNSDYILLNGNLSNNSSFLNFITLNTRYLRLFSDYNIYNYFDSTSFYSNYGRYVDVDSGCSRFLYTTLSDGGYSFIESCNGEYKFKSIIGSDISYDIYEEYTNMSVSSKYNRDYLILHFNNYASSNLSGSTTIIIKNTSSGYIYNLYPYVNSINNLKDSMLLSKGYLNGSFWGFTPAASNIVNKPYYFESFGSFAGGLSIRSYTANYVRLSSSYSYNALTSSTSTLTFNEDDSVPIINLSGTKSPEESLLDNIKDSLEVSCKYTPWSPLCNGGQFSIDSGTDISFQDDGSGNIQVTVTLYDVDSEDCPDIYYTGDNGLVYHQYFNRVCMTQMITQSTDSSPGEYSFLFSGSDLTGLQSQIGVALSGIVGPNFKFYSCPFNSPLRAFHLSSIGGLSSFLLDKFFDINLVGPFNCLLGGILYSETDSVSLGSRLLSDSFHGEKYLNHLSDDVKSTINWLLFAGMVLFFWAFRPKEH